jgi:prephenate dehydrogenase
MSAVADAAATQAPRAERALVDVTGVMGPVVAAGRDHAPDRERLSLHPLFAPANAPGNVAAVHDAAGPVTDRVRAALSGAGNHVFDTTPAEHDEAMRTVQAAAHAAVLAYGLASESVRPEFATPVSRRLDDLVRTVTGGTPRVYRDIQRTFDGAERVAEAARRVAEADDEAFERLYREAGGRDTDR